MRGKTEKLPALDGGWGWFCVIGCSISLGLFGAIGRSMGVFYVAFLNKFEESATATAWVPALTMFFWSGLGPLVTWLCAKFSCRIITFTGGVLMSVGLMTTAFAPCLPFLYVTFGVVTGAGMSCTYASSYLIVRDYFSKRIGVANGLATIGSGLAAFCFPPLIQFLLEFYGFEGMCIIMSAVMLHGCLSGALYRPLNTNHYKVRTHFELKEMSSTDHVERGQSCHREEAHFSDEIKATEEKAEEGSTETSPCSGQVDSPEKQPKNRSMFGLPLLRNVVFSLFLLTMFFCFITITAHVTFVSALAEDNGSSPEKGALLLSAIGISDCAVRPFIGVVFDIGCVRRFRIYLYCVSVALLAGSSIAMGLLAHNYSLLLAACIMRGIATGIVLPQRTTILGDLVGIKQAGSGFGLLMISAAFGSIAAQNIGGLLKDHVGNYNLTFIISGALSLLATLAFIIYISWKHFLKRKGETTLAVGMNRSPTIS